MQPHLILKFDVRGKCISRLTYFLPIVVTDLAGMNELEMRDIDNKFTNIARLQESLICMLNSILLEKNTRLHIVRI